jgi:hypothetical protein
MENTTFCQSCGMPLSPEELKGTENNGLKNNDYCKYCYENGHFKHPEIDLEEMKKAVKTHMEKKKLPDYMIQKALNILPALKRWKNKQFII